MPGEVSREETVWEGSPSQAVNLGLYLICIPFFFLILPLIWAVWRMIQVRCIRYQLTTERLRLTTGVFNRRVDDIELYRVRDTALDEPFFLRLVDQGNIEVVAADAATPVVYLRGIRDPNEVREQIRTQVERTRLRHRVRNLEGLEGTHTLY